MTPLPAGFGITLDRSVRRYRDGRVLVGGHPARAMTLTTAGRDALGELEAGRDATDGARALARRLVDAGMAHPRPPCTARTPDVTVVIPVRDRPAELARCLTALQAATAVVVVDDGSRDPYAVREVARAHGATLVRRERPGGPAAARNFALPYVASELVAFLDSDCVPVPGWPGALAAQFADPLVGAVAPRITPMRRDRGGAWLGAFAAARSPLDMGPEAGAVGPGRAVPYVPTAALLVRREAVAGGFDGELRYGEDVDLVWRLHNAGWRVRYAPEVVVAHDEPRTWRMLLRRRMRYGTSAAPLSRRHPGQLTHVVLSPMPATAAALVLARRPLPALAIVMAHGAILTRTLRGAGVPHSRSALWAAQAAARTMLGAGRAATMLAGPGMAMALCARRGRLAALTLLVAPPLEEWLRRGPALDPVRWTCASIADDVAYGAGVWRGCVEHRTVGPLRPRIRTPRG